MKRLLHNLLPVAVIALLASAGCRKPDVQNPPGGGTGTFRSTSFRLGLDSLPGAPDTPSSIFAVFTVVDSQDQPVLLNKKMSLALYSRYLTDSLVLDSGSYRVTKLHIVNDSNFTLFAMPLTGSPKAQYVHAALPLPFSLPADSMRILIGHVLKVGSSDQPEDFGYPAGSFNRTGAEPAPLPPPGDTVAGYFRVKIHPIISVGDIIYDSIPVSFALTTWKSNGETVVINSSLAAGVNEILVPKSAVRYQFSVTKWGQSDMLTVMRNEIDEHTIYTLGGSRPARKLSSVIHYILQNGSYQPHTRTEYEYDNDGRVITILTQQRREDNSPYLAFTERPFYVQGRVTKIDKFDEFNNKVAASTFIYDIQGRLIGASEMSGNNMTHAEVTYTPLPGKTGISGNYRISFAYEYPGRSFSGFYHKTIVGGVVVNDIYSSTNTQGQQGSYGYDFSINPYVHLKIPDLFLSQTSKHNLVHQQKTYNGNFPALEPYNFSYKYHPDGYPKELVTDYRTYLTGTHAQRIKTIFNY